MHMHMHIYIKLTSRTESHGVTSPLVLTSLEKILSYIINTSSVIYIVHYRINVPTYPKNSSRTLTSPFKCDKIIFYKP